MIPSMIMPILIGGFGKILLALIPVSSDKKFSNFKFEEQRLRKEDRTRWAP